MASIYACPARRDVVIPPYPCLRHGRNAGTAFPTMCFIKAQSIFDAILSEALREDEETDENGVFSTEDSTKVRRRRKDAENKNINYSL